MHSIQMPEFHNLLFLVPLNSNVGQHGTEALQQELGTAADTMVHLLLVHSPTRDRKMFLRVLRVVLWKFSYTSVCNLRSADELCRAKGGSAR